MINMSSQTESTQLHFEERLKQHIAKNLINETLLCVHLQGWSGDTLPWNFFFHGSVSLFLRVGG